MRRMMLATALIVLAAPQSRAQDANAVLQKMYAAYASLRTYTHKASTTGVVNTAVGKQISGLSNELRFSRPNRMYVAVTSPKSGTAVAVSDGKGFISYRSSRNAYRRAPAPHNAAEFAEAARAIGISAGLDPMLLLQGKKIELAGVQSKGTTPVNGVACNVVTGRYTPATSPSAWTATLYIDRSTSLLRKVSLVIKGVPKTILVPTRQGGKVVQESHKVAFDFSLVTVIQEVKVNAAIPDSAFQFSPPAGAVEQKG